MVGQAVITEDWKNKTTNSINMAQLASGTYLVSVEADGVTETKKIVKE